MIKIDVVLWPLKGSSLVEWISLTALQNIDPSYEHRHPYSPRSVIS